MMLIVNPGAGGGTAMRKLKSIEAEIRSRWGEVLLECTRSAEQIRTVVAASFAAGERHFVAAGGDGCVNALLCAIMTALPEDVRGCAALGAIGLGSSNDFHKPLSPDRTISGIPVTMDFSSTRPRDVVKLEFRRNGVQEHRYFLINASAGLTAEANRLFNEPDTLLALLKRTSTGAAILYAAFKTMVNYRNRLLTIEPEGGPLRQTMVTNLAVLKNPHVSGALKFPGKACYGSGLLEFHVASDLHLLGRLRLFQALAAGRAPKGTGFRSWQSHGGTLRGESPFPIEFDGEVIVTDYARFSVLPRHLQVCTC